ncbi:MAG TPA: dihydrolipoamide acetyltransferase family protein [bacterium]|uniref:Dihydrolipoamide acetyltransferase component of pyruvate dehydrogenase complex n=1 Tax=candidate division TA06 bacterium ADurb.Bin417 TaxID=1852828 RepID=A0A1V5MEB3_UNCT6|nr:MAG: Dihydrolipoyllysine-residue acetyltransferase component of pyruvate dehydrogenase complex [candidate division TA06 bacterium ADurb.Bin417]HNS47904.1 dihydrolipoamide acetyltransferase family protein [bacterium]
MVKEIIMPKLGETMEEGFLVKWLKSEGDRVAKGEVIFEVMSDKTNFEVESPRAGILRRILVAAGDRPIPVTTVVGYLADNLEEPLPAGSVVAPAPKTGGAEPLPAAGAEGPVSGRKDDAPVAASPLARRLARELGLPLASIPGTGPGGRVTERDVRSAAEVGLKKGPPAPAASGKKRLSPMRQLIAARLSQSKREIPHYYLRRVLDVSALTAARVRLKASSPEITYTDLLVRAVAAALGEFPDLNATFENDSVTVYETVNLGLAVSVAEGLVVPVIKSAGKLSLAELVAERKRLVALARANRLQRGDLEGGTFTISNLGMYGVDSFYPIIYPPQVAILGVGAIREGLLVRDGSIMIRPLLELTLAADHRVVDGACGGRFLQRIQELIDQDGE